MILLRGRRPIGGHLLEGWVGEPIRVVIAGGAESRLAMRRWLEGAPDVRIVGEADDGAGLSARLDDALPNVAVLDVSVGAATVRQVAARVGVIVVHGAGQEAVVLEALRVGALGHLERGSAQPQGVQAAVRAVARGEAVLSRALAGQIVDEVASRLRLERGTGLLQGGSQQHG